MSILTIRGHYRTAIDHSRTLPRRKPLMHLGKTSTAKRTNVQCRSSGRITPQCHLLCPVPGPRPPSPPPAITYPNACVRHFLPSTAGVTTNQERLSRTASSLTICHPVGFPPSAKFTSTHLTLNARSLKSDCITEQLCLFFFFPSLM